MPIVFLFFVFMPIVFGFIFMPIVFGFFVFMPIIFRLLLLLPKGSSNEPSSLIGTS